MRRFIQSVIVSGAVLGVGLPCAYAQQASLPATQPTRTASADVPVKMVMLFSSGVGYFEHFGTVRDNATTELRFKTAQINDVLKSLVLQDLDGGAITTVTYPSQDPLAKTLKSFQVDIANNPPLADLLNQLRGAAVIVQTHNGEQTAGTILGVETKERQVGDRPQIIKSHVLNLVTAGTIRSLDLDQVLDLRLQDPQLQSELHKALMALVQSRDQDKKPVDIHFAGQGPRRVRLGYVVESPVWKTSYRLLLPAGEKDKPKLQGWAIVENQTDNDWADIQLSLVSGRPISFVQDLYKPLYIPRPVVEPELYASLRPQTYAGGRGEEKAKAADGLRRNAVLSAPAPARAMMEASDMAYASGPMNAAASVASLASTAKVGELFQYTVGHVSLPRQSSAMIPIVTDDVDAQRVSIYNASVLPRNPLNGAILNNTTGKHLLQGPVTVFDSGSYAGDARVDNVPPAQQRLLSYGVDLQMLVDSTKNNSDDSIRTGRIVKGILYLTYKHVATREYQSENKGDRDKTLVIEHPLRQGWKLISDEKPFETTDTLYRFKGNVPAGKTARLTVQEELVQDETLAILPADFGQIDFYSRNGQIPPNVREALAKAATMKQAMVDTERQIEERQKKVADITAEQSRIRENLRTINQNTEYYTRLLKKLNTQETDLEKIQSETDELKTKLQSQRQELENYLSNLDVG